MSNYGWTNDQGEPIMDGAAYRFEQALDAHYDEYEREFDRYDSYEPDYIDPEDCDHADKSWRGWTVECDNGCESIGLAVVKPDWDETDESVVDVIVWL